MADDPMEEALSTVGAEQSWSQIDHRLALLLTRLFAADDATIELTVVVDGTVISGSVVSEQAWVQRQNDQIRIGSPALADAFEVLEPTVGSTRQDRYIHFLEPVLLSGGVHVRMPATRVDLRKVAAWSIGRVAVD
ncbi:hypothetical protein AAIH32_21305 [Pseudarthrobacter oxydans]|uniref:hypothetical protein n=1 Tax=Pseudarthrobacter oxydans TaxID=1671 RepID=UPI003D290A7A